MKKFQYSPICPTAAKVQHYLSFLVLGCIPLNNLSSFRSSLYSQIMGLVTVKDVAIPRCLLWRLFPVPMGDISLWQECPIFVQKLVVNLNSESVRIWFKYTNFFPQKNYILTINNQKNLFIAILSHIHLIINKNEFNNLWTKSGNSYHSAWALQARYLLIAAFRATAEVVKKYWISVQKY